MKIFTEIHKKIPALLSVALIIGCAATPKEHKKSLQEFSGPKQVVILQLPDLSVNQNVTVQLHRFADKKERTIGEGEYRGNIVASAVKGKMKIKIPYGIYDMFVETYAGNYGLIGVKINEDTKIIKFKGKDLL